MSERFRGEDLMKARQLTVELSRENPELYREKILNQLRQTTTYSGKAWDLLKDRGTIDENSLFLNPGTWISETRIDRQNPIRKTITLGTADLPPDLRERLIFEDTRFKGDNEIVYRLSHEVGHEVGSAAISISTKASNLFETIIKMRANGHAIASLGSLDFYRQMGSNVQATEDVVELINMYMIDPTYLDRYLKFLNDPKFQGHRQRLGLYTIPNEHVARTILKGVADGVAKFLNL